MNINLKAAMNVRALLCVIGILFFFESAVFPVEMDFRRHCRGNAALRSAIIPGWGQAFNRQTFKGYVFGTIFFGSVGGYFYYTGLADENYRDYENLGLRNDSRYSDYETHKKQAVTSLSIAAGMWFVAVTDAFIFGRERPEAGDQKKSARSSEFQWTWLESGAGVQWKRYF